MGDKSKVWCLTFCVITTREPWKRPKIQGPNVPWGQTSLWPKRPLSPNVRGQNENYYENYPFSLRTNMYRTILRVCAYVAFPELKSHTSAIKMGFPYPRTRTSTACFLRVCMVWCTGTCKWEYKSTLIQRRTTSQCKSTENWFQEITSLSYHRFC